MLVTIRRSSVLAVGVNSQALLSTTREHATWTMVALINDPRITAILRPRLSVQHSLPSDAYIHPKTDATLHLEGSDVCSMYFPKSVANTVRAYDRTMSSAIIDGCSHAIHVSPQHLCPSTPALPPTLNPLHSDPDPAGGCQSPSSLLSSASARTRLNSDDRTQGPRCRFPPNLQDKCKLYHTVS
ncbi:hypothetical protein CALCODRAFT_495468 [Calocera cornea HHB12733]|uniref:Uncharacterized protein n=1 Tax=Calocera cornea HHB12733 TaxID=1353952 RepID=A0A165GFD0_9BASI|nr:hypothetical protein CALCODRAFT_495468 [Calocera cornea HHB12733]